jgi:hypothetical protein
MDAKSFTESNFDAMSYQSEIRFDTLSITVVGKSMVKCQCKNMQDCMKYMQECMGNVEGTHGIYVGTHEKYVECIHQNNLIIIFTRYIVLPSKVQFYELFPFMNQTLMLTIL